MGFLRALWVTPKRLYRQTLATQAMNSICCLLITAEIFRAIFCLHHRPSICLARNIKGSPERKVHF